MRARIAVAEHSYREYRAATQLRARSSGACTNLQVIEIDERVRHEEELADLPERVNRDISREWKGGRSGFTRWW